MKSGIHVLTALATALIFGVTVRAQTRPTTLPKPPEGTYEVYEWVVFIADPGQPQLNVNAASLFPSTLPDFIGGRRTPAPPEEEGNPMPVGVIRFAGSSGGDKVDVQLTNKGGKFLGHWPKGQNRQAGVLWQNVTIGDAAPPASPEPAGATSWFNTLRKAEVPFILKDGRGERFLTYDLEPAMKLDLKVFAGAGPNDYRVLHNGKTAMKDLVFYKPAEDGWHSATVASLEPTNPPKGTTKPASGPTTAKAETTGDGARATVIGAAGRGLVRIAGARSARVAAVVEVAAEADPAPAPDAPPTLVSPTSAPTTNVTVAATGPVSTRPATSQAATTQAATQPQGTVVTLSTTGERDAATALAPWKETLTAAGLPPTDFEFILDLLKRQALDPKRLTAVYRLDADQMEELMPLEVTPQPRRTTRVGLVIVRNIDPSIVTEIDGLLVQLGDNSWAKREAAYAALHKLGSAAKPKLEAALKTAKDPEVVYRVERLVAGLGQDPNANPGGNPGRRRR